MSDALVNQAAWARELEAVNEAFAGQEAALGLKLQQLAEELATAKQSTTAQQASPHDAARFDALEAVLATVKAGIANTAHKLDELTEPAAANGGLLENAQQIVLRMTESQAELQRALNQQQVAQTDAVRLAAQQLQEHVASAAHERAALHAWHQQGLTALQAAANDRATALVEQVAQARAEGNAVREDARRLASAHLSMADAAAAAAQQRLLASMEEAAAQRQALLDGQAAALAAAEQAAATRDAAQQAALQSARTDADGLRAELQRAASFRAGLVQAHEDAQAALQTALRLHQEQSAQLHAVREQALLAAGTENQRLQALLVETQASSGDARRAVAAAEQALVQARGAAESEQASLQRQLEAAHAAHDRLDQHRSVVQRHLDDALAGRAELAARNDALERHLDQAQAGQRELAGRMADTAVQLERAGAVHHQLEIRIAQLDAGQRARAAEQASRYANEIDRLRGLRRRALLLARERRRSLGADNRVIALATAQAAMQDEVERLRAAAAASRQQLETLRRDRADLRGAIAAMAPSRAGAAAPRETDRRGSMNPSTHPAPNWVPPAHLSALLDLPSAAFVRATYRVLLGREPDPDGQAFFHARLREGVDKLTIVGEFARSDEARAHGAALPGLQAALQRQARWDGGLRRKISAWVSAASAYGGLSRRLNRVEARLDDDMARIDAAIDALDSRLAGLESAQEERLADIALMAQAAWTGASAAARATPQADKLARSMLREASPLQKAARERTHPGGA